MYKLLSVRPEFPAFISAPPCKRFGSSSNSVLVKLIERLMDKGISAY